MTVSLLLPSLWVVLSCHRHFHNQHFYTEISSFFWRERATLVTYAPEDEYVILTKVRSKWERRVNEKEE